MFPPLYQLACHIAHSEITVTSLCILFFNFLFSLIKVSFACFSLYSEKYLSLYSQYSNFSSLNVLLAANSILPELKKEWGVNKQRLCLQRKGMIHNIASGEYIGRGVPKLSILDISSKTMHKNLQHVYTEKWICHIIFKCCFKYK